MNLFTLSLALYLVTIIIIVANLTMTYIYYKSLFNHQYEPQPLITKTNIFNLDYYTPTSRVCVILKINLVTMSEMMKNNKKSATKFKLR